MRKPSRVASEAKSRRFQSHVLLDLVVLVTMVVGAYFLSTRFGVFGELARIAEQNAAVKLPELFGAIFIASVGLGFYGFARALMRAKALQEHIKSEDAVRSSAMHDQLTGLPNRRHLKGILNWHLGQQGDARKLAVVTLDIEKLAAVNDLHGRAAGDELLTRVGELLNMRAGINGFAARLDEDSFAVVLLGRTEEQLMDWLPALLTTLEMPIDLTGKMVEIGATMGVAMGPADAQDAETLLHRADVAMRRAKEKSRGWFAFFKPGMEERVHERAMFEHDLWMAVREDQLEPWFQPIAELKTGEIRGYEVLARWPHRERGLLSPDQFIPAAEGAGLIGDMTINLLRKACRDAAGWAGAPKLSINISPLMLQNPLLAKAILKVCTETGFDPARLEIELTETALVADFDAARAIFLALKEKGVRIALDNFGEGHTSLRQLRELPFDALKIDRSLIGAIVTDPDAAMMVRSMVMLARSIDLEVVAEGLETSMQAELLMAMGCECGQGFHFGKAVGVAELNVQRVAQQPQRKRPPAMDALKNLVREETAA
jgi:diguanylate cyclase (GGDEF)-like protein